MILLTSLVMHLPHVSVSRQGLADVFFLVLLRRTDKYFVKDNSQAQNLGKHPHKQHGETIVAKFQWLL